jgi:hypothetical protein
MTTNEKIAAGINYIRLMKQGMNVYDIAEEMEEDVEHVKGCIAMARKNKDEADQRIKFTLIEPTTHIKDEYFSGKLQVVKGIEVELLKPIVVKYAEDDVTEFQTLLPVRIKVKRS